MPDHTTRRSRAAPATWAALLTAAMFYTAPAFAYLDPGTGSLLLQGLIGAIAFAAFTIRLYWHRLKAYFRKGPDLASTQSSSDEKSE
jgi:hypothetical protein